MTFVRRNGDKFIEAAGHNRNWPDDRAIFRNNARTFLIWVNEEDHLQIISMQQGIDFGLVFRRLCNAVKALELDK